VKGNPNSASSKRMQADVARNVNQEKRVEAGLASGQFTIEEMATAVLLARSAVPATERRAVDELFSSLLLDSDPSQHFALSRRMRSVVGHCIPTSQLARSALLDAASAALSSDQLLDSLQL
jgi:hypothetical protein